MKYIPLTENDVEFSVKIEPCDLPVSGNALCSGDDDVDRAEEDRIIAELCSGNYEAWCDITVIARWKNETGQAHLGACRLSKDYAADMLIAHYGMRNEALDDLNSNVRLLGLTVLERFEL